MDKSESNPFITTVLTFIAIIFIVSCITVYAFYNRTLTNEEFKIKEVQITKRTYKLQKRKPE